MGFILPMGPLLLAFAFGQAPFVRESRPGTERKYRVKMEQDGGDRFEYRLRAKVVRPKVPKGAVLDKEGKETRLLELRLGDYRATIAGQKVSAASMGGGQMPLEETGLPGGLDVTGPSGPVWLPLLALYFPGVREGEFTMPRIAVGSGYSLSGGGKASLDGGKVRIDVEGTFSSGDQTTGKLTLSTTLDRAGWPERSEGTFVGRDGTYRFTLSK